MDCEIFKIIGEQDIKFLCRGHKNILNLKSQKRYVIYYVLQTIEKHITINKL